VFKGLIYPALR